jgi:hypothetical protein
MVDRLLEAMNMTREELVYSFGRRRVLPFTPLWWLITFCLVALLGIVMYAFTVVSILVFPGP